MHPFRLPTRLCALALLFPLALGCASTIGTRQDLDKVTFTIGETHKETVSNTLGLPIDISRSEALGREYWAYQQDPDLAGIMVSGGAGTYTASTGETGEYEFEEADVVYVFDERGILVEARKLREEET